MKNLEYVKEKVAKALEGMGYELYDLSFRHQKDGDTLFIVVDRFAPISLNDIVLVSETLSPLLDELDPFEGAYTLDVSSLGSEKPVPIEKLYLYKGEFIHLHLSRPYKGENDLEGHLLSIDEEAIEIELAIKGRKKKISLPTKDIDKARLAIEL